MGANGKKQAKRMGWESVDPAVVREVVAICVMGTPSIFKPEAFTDKGAPSALIEEVKQVYVSDTSSPTIFGHDGEIIECLYGVYGLTLLERIANDLKADTAVADRKYGRGFRARALQAAIYDKLGIKREVKT